LHSRTRHATPFRMRAPAWAERIVSDVAKRHKRRPPELHWRRSRSRRSAGSADPSGGKQRGVISIEAGRDVVDQRLVVCHELAHWLGRPEEGHSSAFWSRAWGLYRRHRVPIYYAMAREGGYEGAVVAYRQSLEKKRRTGRGTASSLPKKSAASVRVKANRVSNKIARVRRARSPRRSVR